MDDDVRLAINKHAANITEENYSAIIVYKKAGKNVVWTMKVCRSCCPPTILHEDPWATVCPHGGTTPMDQERAAEYIDKFKNAKRMKQLAEWMTPDTPDVKKEEDEGYDKHVIFPIWGEKMTWEEYRTQINIYKAATSKKPASMFLDMINALRLSKKETMSTRLSQALQTNMSDKDIIDRAVRWIETHYGETPIERTDKAMEALQTIRRESGEDITDFIQRFEGVMEQLRVVRFELEERFEAALLHRSANMSKSEANNISS